MPKFLDFLAIAEFSQVVLLIFILFVMDKNRKANIFFAAFLFITSSNFFILYLHKLDNQIPTYILASFAIPGISILGALIYQYVLFIAGLLEKFELKHLLKYIIFFVSLGIFIIAAQYFNWTYFEIPQFRIIVLIIISAGFLNSIIYIIYTIVLLKRYHNKIENYYSDLEKMSLNWLMKITSFSFLALILWCIEFLSSQLWINAKNSMIFAMNMIMQIIIFITAYHLINQPEIFRKNIEIGQAVEGPDNSSESEKYSRQNIDEKMQDEYLEKLIRYMNDNKPYLEESITIKDLAEKVQIPAHHLSIVINSRLNKNFYTFINEYRIKEATAILDDPENSDVSIITIVFRTGFNSKSTFNSVFKKITGQTPSKYRDRINLRSKLVS
ncbi:MAG: helix-turn-helix domain-containing protein [Spirochaetes bacterium]|nr:MAG: helix-turn-helix domain-containing protein [Spirochaetota bacterium]